MATFGNTNISLNAVRATLGESTKSLWNLCHNSNINKWALYSPLTNHGKNISYRCLPVSNPWDCTTWEYKPYNVTEARLGDFRNYEHAATKPVTIAYPTTLYKNVLNTFAAGFAPDTDVSNSIRLKDVYGTANKYFGVAIRKVGANTWSWCTSDTKGSSMVGIDISGLAGLNSGTQVEVITFFSSTMKALSSPDVQADFYSIQCDSETIAKKVYTIQNYVPPTNYEKITIKPSPLNGNWSYDELSFDNITIELKSKISSYYKLKVRLITPDDRYFTDYNMKDVIHIGAGETKIIANTGMMWLRFYQDYSMMFIQVLDMQNSNKLLAEMPITKFIDRQ